MSYTPSPAQKPDPISDALHALMVLQKEASRTTPQGGTTTADQLMQQAQGQGQQQQPQGQPQQPQQPSMQDMVANAGIAGGVQAQQMAQQGQPPQGQMPPPDQGQMPPQGMPPQGMPQMMAEGGIASLPIEDHEYADGGIIGFAGLDEENGSEVPNPEEEKTSTIGDFFRSLGGLGKEFREKELLKNKLRVEQLNANPGLFEALTKSERASRESQASKMAAMLAALQGNTGGATPEDVAGGKVNFDYREGSDPASMAKQLQIAARYEKDPAKQAQIKAEVDRLLASIPPRAPSAERAPFGLDFGAGAGADSSGRPSADDALALAEKFAGKTPDRSKIEALEAQRRKFEEGVQPASTEATTKAYEKEKAGRDFERFILLNEGERNRLGGSGLAEVQFRKSVAERDAAMTAYLEKTRLAEDARQRGNFEGALKYEQDAAKDLLEYNKVRGQVGANVYGTEGSMRNAELSRAGQHERAKATLMAAAIKGMGKNKPTGSTFAEQNILSKMVAENFNSPAAIMKSPDAQELIAKAPNGKKLLTDLQNKNVTAEEFMAHPAVALARKQFKASLMQQSKYAPGMGAEPKDVATAEAEDTDTED